MTAQQLHTYKPVFLDRGIDEEYLNAWFSNYETPTEAQKTALNNVKECNGTTRPVVMLGTYGGGKTHLATALVKNALLARKSAHYYTMTELFREYRGAFNNPEHSESQFFNKILNCDVLAIDEINIRSDSEAESRIIQEVIDRRCSKNKQTVLIGNLDLNDLRDVLTDRLIDRLKGKKAVVITFNWPSHRGNK